MTLYSNFENFFSLSLKIIRNIIRRVDLNDKYSFIHLELTWNRILLQIYETSIPKHLSPCPAEKVSWRSKMEELVILLIRGLFSKLTEKETLEMIHLILSQSVIMFNEKISFVLMVMFLPYLFHYIISGKIV